MEEEKEVKEFFKAILSNSKEIDMAILETYEEMAEEFKKKIEFKDYYPPQIARVDNILKRQLQEQMFENEPNKPIPEDELCKECKKERKSQPENHQYCGKCAGELRDYAEKRGEEIKEELIKDPEFRGITGENKAISYVKHKYKPEKTKNIFLQLSTIAKETYHLMKLGKI